MKKLLAATAAAALTLTLAIAVSAPAASADEVVTPVAPPIVDYPTTAEPGDVVVTLGEGVGEHQEIAWRNLDDLLEHSQIVTSPGEVTISLPYEGDWEVWTSAAIFGGGFDIGDPVIITVEEPTPEPTPTPTPEPTSTPTPTPTPTSTPEPTPTSEPMPTSTPTTPAATPSATPTETGKELAETGGNTAAAAIATALGLAVTAAGVFFSLVKRRRA